MNTIDELAKWQHKLYYELDYALEAARTWREKWNAAADALAEEAFPERLLDL